MAFSRQELGQLEKRISGIGKPNMSRSRAYEKVNCLFAGRRGIDVSYPISLKNHSLEEAQGVVCRWVSEDERMIIAARGQVGMSSERLDAAMERVNAGRELVVELERISLQRMLERNCAGSDPQFS